MKEVILRPKGSIDIMVEAEVINPDIFAGKTKSENEELIVWQGAKQLPLSGFFDVEVRAGNTAANIRIIIDGDVSRVKHIGHGMKAGEIVIEGSAGMHVGSEMIGGSIFVKGDAIRGVGAQMSGGTVSEFSKFAGDFAVSRTPKGFLFASKDTNEGV